MSRRAGPIVSVSAWLVALAGLGWWLLRLGQGGLASPPVADPSAWAAWAEGVGPITAAFALLRLACLAAVAYLNLALLVGAAARLTGRRSLLRLSDAISVGLVRRILNGAVGVGVTTGALAAGSLPLVQATVGAIAAGPSHQLTLAMPVGGDLPGGTDALGRGPMMRTAEPTIGDTPAGPVMRPGHAGAPPGDTGPIMRPAEPGAPPDDTRPIMRPAEPGAPPDDTRPIMRAAELGAPPKGTGPVMQTAESANAAGAAAGAGPHMRAAESGMSSGYAGPTMGAAEPALPDESGPVVTPLDPGPAAVPGEPPSMRAAEAPAPPPTMRAGDTAEPESTTLTGPAPTTGAEPIGAPAPAPSAASPSIAPPAQTASVVLQPGDHLWAVAERHLDAHLGREADGAEITAYWRRLISLNRPQLADPANPDLVFAGQVIRLPPT